MYKEDFTQAEAPGIFYHEPEGSYDLEDYFIKESLDISKRPEFDTTFNLSVSYGSLNFIENDILSEQLTAAKFKKYLFSIEIKDVDGRSFAGQVDFEETYFDEIENVWVVGIKDWLKYHIDIIKQYWWEVTYTNLEDFLRKTFLGPKIPYSFDDRFSIIKDVQVKVRDTSDWIIADQELVLWKGQNRFTPPYNQGDYLKTHTLYDLLFESQKHYGAYLFVDENMRLNFVNTQYLENSYPGPFDGPPDPDGPTNITNLIYNNNFTKIPYQPNEYDGILINQENKISDTQTEASWRMLRYIDGQVEETIILSEDQIADLKKGLSLIDLRQELGFKLKDGGWDGYGSAYEKAMFFGYRVFPQREFDDTLADYTYLLKPVLKWECIIKPTNLSLFSFVGIDGQLYQVFEVKMDGVENEDAITIRKVVE